MRAFHLAGLTSLLGLVFISSASANIVANPGFESGATDWTFNGSTNNPWRIGAGVGIAGAHTGTMDASDGCVGAPCVNPDPDPDGSWLYQDLVTVPGTQYTLSFWWASAGPANELEVLFGSTVADDLVNVPSGPYIQYSNTVTLTAASTTTRLEFIGRQDPGFNSLDDIDVEAGSGTVTPEPSAYVLIGSGLALLAGVAAARRSGQRTITRSASS